MTASPERAVRRVEHTVSRLEISVTASFDDFRRRYETAVPELDEQGIQRLVAEGADWDAVVQAAAENAPHGFMRYWSYDVEPLMALAGDDGRCVEYLMGNHVLAEQMYRHHPGVMLYAPLRTVLYEDASAQTVLAFDQPSTRFASFGDPDIAETGLDLDRKLTALLAHLQTPVPDL